MLHGGMLRGVQNVFLGGPCMLLSSWAVLAGAAAWVFCKMWVSAERSSLMLSPTQLR